MTTGKPAKPRSQPQAAPGTEAWYRLYIEEKIQAIETQSIRALADLGFQPDIALLSDDSFIDDYTNDLIQYYEKRWDQWHRARQHRWAALVEGFVQTLEVVYRCRHALARGDIWALAYHIQFLEPGERSFFSRKGAAVWRGARSGGRRRTTGDRDLQLAQEYLLEREKQPKGSKTYVMDKVATRHGIAIATGRKAINRGLALMK